MLVEELRPGVVGFTYLSKMKLICMQRNSNITDLWHRRAGCHTLCRKVNIGNGRHMLISSWPARNTRMEGYPATWCSWHMACSATQSTCACVERVGVRDPDL